MDIQRFKLTSGSDRHVFIIQERRNAKAEGLLIVVSNRRLVLKWLKSLEGHLYMERNGQLSAPMVSYTMLAKDLQTHGYLFVCVVPKELSSPRQRFEIIKAPLLREL